MLIGRGKKLPTKKRERGKVKIKTELLQDYLDEHELTAAILARNMGVNTAEVEKLFGKRGNGAAVYLLL